MVTANGTVIIFEDSVINSATGVLNTGNPDPTVIRKRVYCICNLPVCKCGKSENPENWYVKTFLHKDARIMPARYNLYRQNSISEPLNFSKTLDSDDKLFKESHLKRNQEIGFKTKRSRKRNKWLFGCPPLLNLKKEPEIDEIRSESIINFQCVCSQCKFQSGKNKLGILIKCNNCGPIYLNSTIDQTNYSNLILQRNNRLKMKVKFLQIN